MKKILLIVCALFLMSCDSEKQPNVTEQAAKPTLSQQIHAPLDKAKGVENLLQQGKDERDKALNQQLQ